LSVLPEDERGNQRNAAVAYSYTLTPGVNDKSENAAEEESSNISTEPAEYPFAASCIARFRSLTTQNQLDISGSQWNTSPFMVNSGMPWDWNSTVSRLEVPNETVQNIRTNLGDGRSGLGFYRVVYRGSGPGPG
ncbi:hypothetical protein ACFL5Q_05765, partial [Planctomycetota bacterium]